MEGISLLCSVVFLVFLVKDLVAGDPVFAYGESSSIFIKKVQSGQLVKSFKIKEYDDIYVAINYKEDLIFYSRDDKLYRIHLLDDNGNRKVSGNGELFRDTLADHSEQFLLKAKYNIGNLQVDETRKKLFLTVYDSIFEMDFDASNMRKVVVGKSIQSYMLYQDTFYFADQGKSWSEHGIFSAKYDSTATVDCVKGGCKEIVVPKRDNIFTITVESNKLFYRIGNSINVVDANLADTAYPVNNPRVVLSDSQFVNGRGAQPIGVSGRYMIWNQMPGSSGQLMLGIMNNDRTFISKKNIYVYGKMSYGFQPRQLAMFDLPSTKPSTAPTTTPKKCLCPCPKSNNIPLKVASGR